MMSKVLIVGMKTYSFLKDDKELVEGAKVSYLGEFASTKKNEFGFLPLQVNVNLNIAKEQIKEVPGIYDLSFDMVAGKNNKPELVITGFEFIKSVDFVEAFNC